VPAPAPAQPEEEIEEVLGRDYFFSEDLLPSPTPTQEDSAPPPAPLAPVAPALAPGGGDTEDPGDDEEAEDNQDDGPPAQREPCCEHTSFHETATAP